jgi:hypothetical protein
MSRWTDEELRELITLWPTHSVSQIVKRLDRPFWPPSEIFPGSVSNVLKAHRLPCRHDPQKQFVRATRIGLQHCPYVAKA